MTTATPSATAAESRPPKPRYRDLPRVGGEACAWDVFGHSDELGTLNWLGPEAVLSAVTEVVTGQVVNLDVPLGFGADLSNGRSTHHHEIFVRRSGMDDRLDGLFPQSSSQWDGFRHVRYREFGYFGGHADDHAVLADGRLGIDAWARGGIIGRGVVVDVPAFITATGRDWQPWLRETVTPALLEAVLESQEVELRHGDVLLINTGWLGWFITLDGPARSAVGTVDTMQGVGLDPSAAMAEWLWDHGVAAVAADNPALEALPVKPATGFLHRRLLALLGMPIGELWALHEAARICAALGRYTGLLTSSPLYLEGGVGTPANAYLVL